MGNHRQAQRTQERKKGGEGGCEALSWTESPLEETECGASQWLRCCQMRRNSAFVLPCSVVVTLPLWDLQLK